MYIYIHVHTCIHVCSCAPVSGGVVAEVGEEVVVELPEDVERDAAVRGGDGLVGLVVQGGPRVQRHMLRQHLVSQPVDVQ